MIYLDERLPTHPKLLRAADLLGPDGHARAFMIYVLGIAYARQHLTNGFLPASFPRTVQTVSAVDKVASTLCHKSVGLWRKVSGGYEIHDYLQWNQNSEIVKEKRQKDRDRKRAERGRK